MLYIDTVCIQRCMHEVNTNSDLPEFPSKSMSSPLPSTAWEKESRCRAASSPPLLFTK